MLRRPREMMLASLARRLRERLRREGGQSLVVLAFGLVGVIGFVGLATDTLLVIVGQARLVRAVDAASLAAATLYREGASLSEMKSMAVQFVSLNGADPASTRLATCEGEDPAGWYSGTLCPGLDYRRKVLVRAELPVGMAFLRLLGFRSVVLTAEATGEAASLDVMIALDRSESMARDTDLGPPGPDDCDGDGPDADDVRDFDCDGMEDSDPQECNPGDTCQPFRQVKDAALGFLDHLNPTFDRVAVVFFDQEAQQGLTPMTADMTAARNVIDNRNVYSPPPCMTYPPDPSPCPSTNVGGGLLLSNNELTAGPQPRDDALWIVILLTDGAANTTNRIGGGPHQWPNVHCPPVTWGPPFCRDWDAATRHPGPGQPGFDINEYDADDWARDSADFVAGNQIVIFTIGLGDLLTNNTSGGTPDGGEQLLRYIAAAGDDGDASTDPCLGEPIGTNCGNYYFSPTAAQLGDIFSDIAERVLTRLVS